MRLLIVVGLTLLFVEGLLFYLTRQYYIHIGSLGRHPIGWPLWSFGYLVCASANGFIAAKLVQEILGKSHILPWVLVVFLCLVCLLFIVLGFAIAISKGDVPVEDDGE